MVEKFLMLFVCALFWYRMNINDLNRRLATVRRYQTLSAIPAVSKNSEGFYVAFGNFTLVFTDGCLYPRSNTFSSSAGYGVWFGVNHKL